MKLGFWQLERLEWKQALLDQIEINMTAAPVPLGDISNPGDSEYARVCAAGEFNHEKEIHLFSTNLAGTAGYFIYTPLERKDGDSVFVNRGWVPGHLKDPASRPDGQLSGYVNVCGVLRIEETKGTFVGENDPRANVWTHRDLAAMAAFANLDDPFPGFIDSDGEENPDQYPVGGQTRVNIPNNHLGYAITWFGLAGALLGVFIVFAVESRRKL